MKIATMRQIDRWVGAVCCFLLTIIQKVKSVVFPTKNSSKRLKSILIIKLAEQGATVLAYNSILRAMEMVGKENIYFLVFEENRPILDVMNVIPRENIFTIDSRNFGRFTVSALQVLRKIRKLQIDAAVDFEFFARGSAVLTCLSGAKIRVGMHSFAGEGPYRGDLMTHKISYNPHIHTSQMFETMVLAINSPAEQLPALNFDTPKAQDFALLFNPEPAEIDVVKKLINGNPGDKAKKLILLNSNASDLLPLRRWPSERYVELARKLLEKSPDVKIAFTGTKAETEAAEKMASSINSDRCFSLAGKTSFRQLMVLYHTADLLVTNDSGPAHFATLTPAKVIVLFGPETPTLFGAKNANTSVIWKNIPCSPCVNAYNNRFSACKNNICLQKITVDEVFHLSCKLCNL